MSQDRDDLSPDARAALDEVMGNRIEAPVSEAPAPAAAITAPAPAAAPAVRPPVDLPLFADSDDVSQLWRLAGFLANSDLLPEALTTKGNVRGRYNALLMMLVGKDRGLTPLQALSGGLHIIEGKVEIGAHAMVALVLKSGAAEYIKPVMALCNDTQAVYRTRRRDWPPNEFEDFVFTIDDAARMLLLDKGKTEWAKANNNWRRMPKTMLMRRAASGCCREFYSDVVLGLYDHGELGALGIEASPVPGRANAMAEAALTELALMKERDAAGATDAEVVEAAPKRADAMADRLKAKAKAGRAKGPEADKDTGRGMTIGQCARCATDDLELQDGICQACQ